MRPATEALWSRLSQHHHHQQQQRHQDLLSAASDCGFFALHLSQRCLFRSSAGAATTGRLLGSLSVFGCLADGRCPDSGAGSDLVCREVDLVRSGASKTGLNALLGAVCQAENVGRPVCLAMELEQPEAGGALARDIVLAMRDAWPKGSRCCYRAAAFLLVSFSDGGSSPGVSTSVRRLGMETKLTVEGVEEEEEMLETVATCGAVLIAFEAACTGKLEARGS